jgi:uncharacterized delta-60 repeat protein
MLLVLLSSAAPASAQPQFGHLDPSFGERGRASTSLNVTDKFGDVELGVAPDGSAVLADQGILVRVRPDGSRDLRFGNEGKLVLRDDTAAEGVVERTFFPGNIAVDDRGRVLVFGQQTDRREIHEPNGMFNPLSASSAIVLRFSGRGERDPSFGDGRGFIREDFGLASEFSTETPLVSALTGRVDSRDRPVLVAGVSSTTSACNGHSFINSQPRAVVRLTETGMPDPSFGGGDGISPIEGSNGFSGLEVDAADRPVVAVGRIGGVRTECRLGTTLIRLRRDGERLAGFGAGGIRELRRLNLDVLQSSGAMILSQRRKQALIQLRLKSDGDRDLSFGGNGSARVALPAGFHVRPVAVDERKRILLAGFYNSGKPGSVERRQRPGSFAVIRLLPSGRPDRTFGDNGWIVTPFARPLKIDSATATLDPRGRLLVAGTVTTPHRPNGGFVLARYLLGP